MRTWIYNRIKNLAALGAEFKVPGKIISSGSADNPDGPFMIISMGVEQTPLGMPSESRTQRVPFTIWVHDKPGSMVRIDDAAKVLKDDFPTPDGFKIGPTFSVFNVEWTDTGGDSYDDHFGTNCRPVRFSAMTHR